MVGALPRARSDATVVRSGGGDALPSPSGASARPATWGGSLAGNDSSTISSTSCSLAGRERGTGCGADMANPSRAADGGNDAAGAGAIAAHAAAQLAAAVADRAYVVTRARRAAWRFVARVHRRRVRRGNRSRLRR